MNLGLTTKDNPDRVLENRRRVEKEFNLTLQSLAGQVHGNEVLVIRSEKQIAAHDSLPNADSIISNLPGLTIAMFFADCLPVYFWDPVTRSAGLAHAGWRGTLAGVSSGTVAALQREFQVNPKNLRVAIGPSIGPCCFEVLEDVALDFQSRFENEVVLQKENRYRINLWKANMIQLREKGVEALNIEMAGKCTSCQPELYYSYRRDKGETGRMAGVIKLKRA